MDREIEKLKLEKKDLIKRIINLVNDVVELDRRIYKALCLIDEKRGEYDIPEELENILRGREDDEGRKE